MANGIRKKVAADPSMTYIFGPDNWVAARDISLRVLAEVLLILAVYYLVERGYNLLGFTAFYVLAIWHSFWGYAGIGHELFHRTVFSNRSLNGALYYVASFLVWSNPVFFRHSHRFHHLNTFSADDVEVNGFQKLGHRKVIVLLTLDPFLMLRRIGYTVINSVGYKYVQWRLEKIPQAHALAAKMALLFHLSLNSLIYFATQNIFYNVLWILLPFTGQFFNRQLAYLQHSNLREYRDLGPLRNSRSIRLPPLVSFLYAGMNYHAEHHLMPSVPYYHLPALSAYLARFHGHRVEDWGSSQPEYLGLIRPVRGTRSKQTENSPPKLSP